MAASFINFRFLSTVRKSPIFNNTQIAVQKQEMYVYSAICVLYIGFIQWKNIIN